MDRGFYSEANINDLCKNHLKFLIATKVSLMFVKTEIDKVRDSIVHGQTTARSIIYMPVQPL